MHIFHSKGNLIKKQRSRCYFGEAPAQRYVFKCKKCDKLIYETDNICVSEKELLNEFYWRD